MKQLVGLRWYADSLGSVCRAVMYFEVYFGFHAWAAGPAVMSGEPQESGRGFDAPWFAPFAGGDGDGRAGGTD